MQMEIVEGYRLSPQQEHLWLLLQTGNAAHYRGQCAVLIEGELQLGTLKTALRKVVERHEILRTAFHRLPGMSVPVQVIEENTAQFCELEDLSTLSEQEQESRIEELFDEASRHPFDFESFSLFRASVLILSPHRNVLLLTLPALCADAEGLKRLANEICLSYDACRRGEELLDEPVQYADLSEWQNELLESDETAPGREYWRKQNFTSPSALKLPLEV